MEPCQSVIDFLKIRHFLMLLLFVELGLTGFRMHPARACLFSSNVPLYYHAYSLFAFTSLIAFWSLIAPDPGWLSVSGRFFSFQPGPV